MTLTIEWTNQVNYTDKPEVSKARSKEECS